MLVQRFHPGIQSNPQLLLARSGHPLFSRQGHWDGGSTVHCVAMALALLGKLDDPVWLPYHESDNERTFWDRAWPHYLHGMTLPELAGFVAELELGLRCVEHDGQACNLLHFCERELHAGWPVIIG